MWLMLLSSIANYIMLTFRLLSDLLRLSCSLPFAYEEEVEWTATKLKGNVKVKI